MKPHLKSTLIACKIVLSSENPGGTQQSYLLWEAVPIYIQKSTLTDTCTLLGPSLSAKQSRLFHRQPVVYTEVEKLGRCLPGGQTVKKSSAWERFDFVIRLKDTSNTRLTGGISSVQVFKITRHAFSTQELCCQPTITTMEESRLGKAHTAVSSGEGNRYPRCHMLLTTTEVFMSATVLLCFQVFSLSSWTWKRLRWLYTGKVCWKLCFLECLFQVFSWQHQGSSKICQVRGPHSRSGARCFLSE